MKSIMTKHTPGPWKVYQLSPDSDNQERWIITADRGSLVDDIEVCGVVEKYDNAVLLAAAPDLITTAKRLVESMEKQAGEILDNGCTRGMEGFEVIRDFHALRSVIAKIEGNPL